MDAETYKYNSVTVAKFVVAYAHKECITINMTKLQKLLYIAYGLYLAVKNSRLLNEHPQAWPYGPVFPTTRNKLLKLDLTNISLDDPEFKEIKADNEIESLLNLVFKSFGKLSANQLSEWSHQSGSPWEETVSSPEFNWGKRIDDDMIQSYFSKMIEHE